MEQGQGKTEALTVDHKSESHQTRSKHGQDATAKGNREGADVPLDISI